MFEIGVLEFYHLHKIVKDKLKVLVGLDHVVHFFTNHLEMFCHASLSFCSPLSIKSNAEVSTLLLLHDVSFKLCAVDLFSNTISNVHRHGLSLFSFTVGLGPKFKC